VAEFLSHSHFFDGVVAGVVERGMNVKPDDGTELLGERSRYWTRGERVKVFIRPPKFEIHYKGGHTPEPEANYFEGKIKDRGYTGAEVRYFMELNKGALICGINGMKSRPFNRGEKVNAHVAMRHCRLLAKESDQV